MVKYLVNKEKGVVVAYMNGCSNDALAEVEPIFGTELTYYDSQLKEYLVLQSTFKGIARLKPNDVFDENIGKNVAKAKLLKTYLNAKANAIYKYREEVQNRLNNLDKKIAKLYASAEHQRKTLMEF